MSWVDLSIVSSNIVIVLSGLALGGLWLWRTWSALGRVEDVAQTVNGHLEECRDQLCAIRARLDADHRLRDRIDRGPLPPLGPMELGPPS